VNTAKGKNGHPPQSDQGDDESRNQMREYLERHKAWHERKQRHEAEHGPGSFQEPAPDFPGSKITWPQVEEQSAAKLHSMIGKVRCVGEEWYAVNGGIWRPSNADIYRPDALKVIPKQFRTQKYSQYVIKRLESEQQVSGDHFFGAAKFDGSGAVLIAVQNGTLRISSEKVELLPPDPAHGFTASLSVKWDPEAKSELFDKVFQETLSDPDEREVFLDVLATALIPDCRFETALVLIGEAGTGKSTIIAPLPAIFGASCSSLSLVDLCHPSGYKLPGLKHKMVNLTTELNTLEMEDSGLFKQLVSGEMFTARPIYGRPYEMRSMATFVFLANSLPRFKHGTDAEVRRLQFVRCGRKVDKPDTTLKDQVAADAPGVFVKLVCRAKELLAGRPISKPGQFGRETSDRFSVSNDPIGQFVSRHCLLNTDSWCEKEVIQAIFACFRDRHSISVKLDDSVFFKQLYDRFPAIKQSQKTVSGTRTRILVGIRITPEAMSEFGGDNYYQPDMF
jgi:phage/plasmid-associated DNA primase